MITNISEIKSKIIDSSINAKNDQDWENIDLEIQSLKLLPNQNEIATELLKYIQHADSQVRDATVSSLVVLEISDKQLLDIALKFASKMAIDPNENIYSSGRSAILLNKYKNLPNILDSLTVFKQNVKNNNWQTDLIENIPGINILL